MKFLAMHITNQKLSFDIFTVVSLQNIFIEHDLNILMIFVIKEKCIILTHTMYCCLLLQIYLRYLWLLLCCRDTYGYYKFSSNHQAMLHLVQSVCEKISLAIKQKTPQQNMISSKCLNQFCSQFLYQFYWCVFTVWRIFVYNLSQLTLLCSPHLHK